MSSGGEVVIKITGDDSEYEKKLNELEKKAKKAASAIDQVTKSSEKASSAINDTKGMDELGDKAEEASKSVEQIARNAEQVSDAFDDTKSVDKMGDSIEDTGEKTEELNKSLKDAGEAAEQAGSKGEKAAGRSKMSLADLKAGIDLTTAVLNKFADVAKKGIDYNATMESYRTSFEVMTGSAEKAAEVVERLRTMGAETPFETTDLVQTTQLLMQYGFTADDAISKMSMLGDIAQGNREAMNSIAMGYAQMSSAGKVNLQDIKQMINVCHAA